MGQEASTHVDESVLPQTLRDRSVDAVAKLITEERARKIVVMVSLALIEKQGAEEETASSLRPNNDRPVPALARLQVFQIFGHPTQVFTPISLASTSPSQRRYLIYHSSARTLFPSTLLPMSCILGNTGLP